VLIAEPPRTRFDLNFRLAGFPVRIHPAFWLMGGVLGLQGEDTDAIELAIWVAAILVSILVHELGHAYLVRRQGWVSRIILYHFGGLATIESPPSFFNTNDELPPKAKIAIALAGPGAGFVFGGVILGMLALCPINLRMAPDERYGFWFDFEIAGRSQPLPLPRVHRLLEGTRVGGPTSGSAAYESHVNLLERLTGRRISLRDDPEAARQVLASYASHRRLRALIDDLLFVNIFWGLINLLPIFPLDGGQVARELFCLRHPYKGTEKSLRLSSVVAMIVGGVGLLHFLRLEAYSTGIFFAVMFGMLAYLNYRVLQQLRAMGGYDGNGHDHGSYEPEDWWKR